ncbi:unnamed protein product [Spirodela intermedia]|uniref:ACB domain-containing protein n=1 Tax=Spirodela intermedia TaxID=51605 RepID=A0A7I8IVN8_SPIIN|nr:unnamed protein product [Spirodela intermedia]CAA6662057.1 unnamed protein product [Spirodela intermedia]
MAVSASSGLAYPEKFTAAAAYVGFGGSQNSSSIGAISRFPNDVALLLYGLYQQVRLSGLAMSRKPRAWNAVEHGKWTSWDGLGNLASTEAMRLFVKILEEEDPAWYSRTPELVEGPIVDVEMNVTKPGLRLPDGNSHPEPISIIAESGNMLETQDKDVILEGLAAVSIYDQWIGPSVSGKYPKPRYKHGAAIVQDKMYVFGGNHNGRYLNDLQVLDLKTLTWTKVEAKSAVEDSSLSNTAVPVSCAGHSLVSWENKILLVAGHLKNPSEYVTVREFDPQTLQWSKLNTHGKAPDEKRSLLNDLHILDLETMTWNEVDAIGQPPSPRMDHTAAIHAERYLLIFGGASYATCFSDLHVLDLKIMEWSRPKQQGVIPAPRAGHAGTTIGENWFIVGGGDNKNGISETLVLNMSTLVWSVVTAVQGRVPIASEGLSLVASSYTGEDILLSFGGYNGRYCNDVYALKPSHKTTLQSKIFEESVAESVAGLPTNATRDIEPELDTDQDGKVREIVMDSIDSRLKARTEETYEQQLANLQGEKEELAMILSKEQSQTSQLKQELAEAATQNSELMKELQSIRSQLAAEQSRCFKLEVDVAEMRQKLQTVESLQNEVELLRRQKAALEQAAMTPTQKQGSGGVWGWLAGTPPNKPSP